MKFYISISCRTFSSWNTCSDQQLENVTEPADNTAQRQELLQKRRPHKRSLPGTGDQYKADSISHGSSVPRLTDRHLKVWLLSQHRRECSGHSRVKACHPKRGTWAPGSVCYFDVELTKLALLQEILMIILPINYGIIRWRR